MTDDHWRKRAACMHVDVGVFFPDERASIVPAQRICATCPVWRECAVDSTVGRPLRFRSTEGAWCGIGGSLRGALLVALRDVDHPPERECTDDDCGWCVQLRNHRRRLDVVAGTRDRSEVDRIVSFGPNATHGNRVTHARGCRCAPCRFSASTAAKRLKLAGVDPVLWWEWQFSPFGGETTTAEWSTLDDDLAGAVLARAKVAADAFLQQITQVA
jgi:hypothetical protein